MQRRDRYGEDREYTDFFLKELVKRLRKQLSEFYPNDEKLSREELIKKLSIVEELKERYATLNLISDDDIDYGELSSYYYEKAKELKKLIGNDAHRVHNQDADAQSWNEYREEEQEKDLDEEEEER